ncbi:hypothetical protein C4K04_2783 [Pseudomonas chlororaphis]|uniref:Uncharacterized protein n=1 Tax=Pseudomonas chlororaphis TaxID=587753 RepID=A0A3G7TMW1_9PSED|nr:hypothetical protein C4K04_2783 [Pseudomonas chlororaphis]
MRPIARQLDKYSQLVSLPALLRGTDKLPYGKQAALPSEQQ